MQKKISTQTSDPRKETSYIEDKDNYLEPETIEIPTQSNTLTLKTKDIYYKDTTKNDDNYHINVDITNMKRLEIRNRIRKTLEE